MTNRQKKDLHLMILNSNIRTADSRMINAFAKTVSDNMQTNIKFASILLANEQNNIKTQFDIQQAKLLQNDSKLVIYYSHQSKKLLTGIKHILSGIKTIYVYAQDVFYNMEVLEQIAKIFPSQQVAYRYNQDPSLDQQQFRCVFELFQDYLCSDTLAEKFRPSNSYSWFRAKFIPRELIKRDSKSIALLANKKSANIAQALQLQLISTVQQGDVIFPEQTAVWKAFSKHLINYSESRGKLGSLFDFSKSSSSFQSPFLSAGVISTAQLLDDISLSEPSAIIQGLMKKAKEKARDKETDQVYSIAKLKDSISKYRDEVLWAEFCYLYWINNKDILYKNNRLVSGGLYDRKTKWVKNSKLMHQFEYGLLDDEFSLINAAMNQLRSQGYMSNYLRMIVASFCMQQNLDWRECLVLFERYLIDIQWASNLFGWLFSYNLVQGRKHVFSIPLQTHKRDKDKTYRGKWNGQKNKN